MANISQINGLNINAETASYALFAATVSGSVTNAVSASYASVAQTLLGSVVSASYATTASYASTAQTLLGSVVSASYAATASLAPNYVLNSATSSFVLNSQTGSFITNTQTSSMSVATASYVNTLNQDVLIVNSLTVGSSSLGGGENTLTVGLPPNGGVGEGGQILLMASGGLYSSASMIDNYQNKFRILRGTNAGSDAFKMQIDLQTGQIQIPNYTGSGAFPGTAAATLAVDSSGNVITTTGGGGGGTPGGNANEVQYNDGAGGFAGAANVEISANGNLNLIAQTDPSTPAAGVMALYSKDIASRIVPKVKGPSGLDYALQSSLWQNDIYLWTQTTATNGVWQGTSGTGAGTFSSVTSPTINGTGTIYQSIRRARYANVVTTTNQVLGQRNADAIFFRGAATGQGGFFFYTRCGFDVWTNGGRFFAGMATATTVISADPSALNNTVGFCVDAADNGAISFLTRGTSATKVSTGLTISSNKGYDIFIFNAPNSGTIGYRIIDINTGTEFSGTTTTNVPAAGTGLTANVLASNAALTTATAIQLGVVKIYIEVDY